MEIADYIATGSIDYYNADWASLPLSALEILQVFVNSFDLIFRVATLAAVAHFVVSQMMNAGRARLMKFASIAAVLALSALTIIGIAFRGVNEGHLVAYEYAANTGDSYVEYYQEEREVKHWRLRIAQVQMAFYAVYFVAVLAIFVASFLTRNVSPAILTSLIPFVEAPHTDHPHQRVLSSAVLVLLTITVLEVVHTAWAVYIRTNTSYDYEYDSDGFDIYVQIAWIFEIILQTGLLVTLLFAPPRPFK